MIQCENSGCPKVWVRNTRFLSLVGRSADIDSWHSSTYRAPASRPPCLRSGSAMTAARFWASLVRIRRRHRAAEAAKCRRSCRASDASACSTLCTCYIPWTRRRRDTVRLRHRLIRLSSQPSDISTTTFTYLLKEEICFYVFVSPRLVSPIPLIPSYFYLCIA